MFWKINVLEALFNQFPEWTIKASQMNAWKIYVVSNLSIRNHWKYTISLHWHDKNWHNGYKYFDLEYAFWETFSGSSSCKDFGCSSAECQLRSKQLISSARVNNCGLIGDAPAHCCVFIIVVTVVSWTYRYAYYLIMNLSFKVCLCAYASPHTQTDAWMSAGLSLICQIVSLLTD